jgi:hypothetical protein
VESLPLVCLPLKADVFAICIEKYRFLVFITTDYWLITGERSDKTNIKDENWTEKSEQTVNVRSDS